MTPFMRGIKCLLFACLFFLSSLLSRAQVVKPYVQGGLSLMPDGYAAFAGRVEGGLDLETSHLVGEAATAYDNGRKTTGYTLNNFRGHDRYLAGFVGVKYDNVFVGGGARWNQLESSNYPQDIGEQKVNFFEKGMRFTVGGGYDWQMVRLEGQYLLPSKYECDAGGCSNHISHNTQGTEVSLTFPSPASKKHLFYKQTIELFHYHNIGSGGGMAESVDFSIRYRF